MTWVGEIIEVVKGIGQFHKWYRSRRNPPVESLPARFVRLFESHGVHRNQIPRFIGHGLALKDMEDDASLLAKLDETLLEFVCERFAVRREWLDGAESRIHHCHDFYKSTEAFANFIAKLKSDNPTGGLCGVLIAPVEAGVDAVGLLILQETVNLNGDKSIYRFHFCGDWAFTYWKARAYLAACMAIAWKQQVFVHGIYMPKKKIARFSRGKHAVKLAGPWYLGAWSQSVEPGGYGAPARGISKGH